MRVTILGSGTLVPDGEGHSPGHLVETAGASVLLDCGSGTVHGLARFGKPWAELSHVVVSHFHTDHLGDVAPLLFALRHALDPPRVRPLTMLGPVGLATFLRALAAAFGDYVVEPGFPVDVLELEQGASWEAPDGSFRLRSHPARHPQPSLAYRVEGPAGAVGYTGDTGPSDSLGAFMAGVDLLVTECSHPDPSPVETHLTPGGVAVLAGRAHPRVVVTVHHYPSLDPAQVPTLVAAAGYGGRVLAARDGLELEVTADRVRVLSKAARHPGGG